MTTNHKLTALESEPVTYATYLHVGDCGGTLCSSCGCCIHCADDCLCDQGSGCSSDECGCSAL